MLTVDGQNPNANVNAARLNPKTGEVIFENLQANGCTVTRRVYLDKVDGYIRYIDVFKNTQNAPKDVADHDPIDLQTTALTPARTLPIRKERSEHRWVGTDWREPVDRSEMYAGKGSKIAPQINWPQGNKRHPGDVPDHAGRRQGSRDHAHA